MNKIKQIASATLIILIIFLSGLFVGRFYFAKTEIKIKDRIVYKTVYKEKVSIEYNKENFDKLLWCYNSPINFKDKTESNKLFVTAFDECKEATIQYEIGTKNNWRIYAGWAFVGALAGGIIYKTIH